MVDVFVHEHGLCETDRVGRGTRIWAFAHVLAGAQIGAECNICDGVFIEGGAVVGEQPGQHQDRSTMTRPACRQQPAGGGEAGVLRECPGHLEHRQQRMRWTDVSRR